MTVLVTQAQLLAFAPQALAPISTSAGLSKHMADCEINTPRRVRHFMAHLAVESMYFTRLEENLNYSVARLQEVWPSRFPTPASAMPYARNPRELAKKVYGGRMGNDTLLDGWLFRGGAWIMITGEDNYRRAAAWSKLPLVEHPELARTPDNASQIAAYFWRSKGLNAIVDADKDEAILKTLRDQVLINEADDLVEGTRVINGELTGLDARGNALLAASKIWA